MKRFFTVVLLALVSVSLFAYNFDEDDDGYEAYDYYVNDSCIRNTLRATARKVYDRDGDGKVNCIDYTLTFKKEWNKTLPPAQCEIVRNYKKVGWCTIMNHLFVRVRLTPGGKWLYIEPQAEYTMYNYKMSDYWGCRYDPSYNRLGETSYWLGECKR